MTRSQNVGGVDRIARLVLGTLMIVLAIRFFRSGRRGRSVVAAVFGLGLLRNVQTGYCGCNDLLGIDTTRNESADR